MPFWKKKIGMGDEKPFNFAKDLLERCGDLFREANQSSIDQDPMRWYRVLRTVKRAISFVQVKSTVDEKSIEKLTLELNKMRTRLKVASQSQSEVLYLEVEDALEKIEEQIIGLMYQHELYYPKYDTRGWEQKLEDEDK